jgi:hypothetical protein
MTLLCAHYEQFADVFNATKIQNYDKQNFTNELQCFE